MLIRLKFLQASLRVRRAATGIVKSYQSQFNTSQIFISSKDIPVYWAHISVIDAELICLNDLLKLSSWKYVITTAGSELPIHSHKKIRADLEAADDQGDLDTCEVKDKHTSIFKGPFIN